MRITGIDTARFLAYCGMVLVNFRLAAEVTGTDDWPSRITDALEGRAAALFVVLAGVGLTLGRAGKGDTLRRALLLMVLGLCNLTIFDADILHFYALYFVAALPFLSAPPKTLWLAILGVLCLTSGAHFLLDYDQNWDWDTLSYARFWTIDGFALHSLFNGWHPVLPWFAFLLLGLWVGQLRLHRRPVQLALVCGGALAAVLGAMPQQFVTNPDLHALLDTAMIPPGPTYVFTAGGSAVAALGLVLIVQPVLDRLKIAVWLIAPGRMALSLYLLHILLGMGTLEELGLLQGQLSATEIFFISLLACTVSAGMSVLWARHFGLGPLERLMRWVAKR